ncbi:hypothetical protein [Pseudoalteromonas sp. BDTF-M6]|uniref:hypothetical protein n=1 Tax=Pseudoalteromonas sp. BDTF-M6 TaxID=2796132 RepID=UPI001BAF6371|nr:hypothetical protein [Pseudoalteromonas sp. BDTF-M6]MBS3796791.1 hypothetical protein [Pseudoalteromonas sp. BDTF-M6]
MKSITNLATWAFGYILFMPFIIFYSYILGPILKAILLPGGLTLLTLILGPKETIRAWRDANASGQNSKSG